MLADINAILFLFPLSFVLPKAGVSRQSASQSSTPATTSSKGGSFNNMSGKSCRILIFTHTLFTTRSKRSDVSNGSFYRTLGLSVWSIWLLLSFFLHYHSTLSSFVITILVRVTNISPLLGWHARQLLFRHCHIFPPDVNRRPLYARLPHLQSPGLRLHPAPALTGSSPAWPSRRPKQGESRAVWFPKTSNRG